MNSNRMLGLTTKSQAKSTEKLSSGYKINRAADDAAGLAISEKMRRQVRGLTQASSNAQDGISAVQTAEGALTEVHDMLQRMNELATKAANGTNSSEERDYIQSEVDALISEIDRVSETTKFNEIYLLKGEGNKEVKVATAAVEGQEKKVEYQTDYGTDSGVVAVAAANTDGKFLTELKKIKDDSGAGSTITNLNVVQLQEDGTFKEVKTNAVKEADLKDYFELGDDGKVKAKDGYSFYSVAAGSTGEYGDQLKDKLVAEADVAKLFEAGSTKLLKQDGTAVTDTELAAQFEDDGTYKGELYYKAADGTVTEVGADKISTFVKVTPKVEEQEAGTETKTVAGDLKFNLHVGAEGNTANKIEVKIAAMSAEGIGVDGLKGSGVKTEEAATAAIETIKGAIKTVSQQRSDLGAVQNRLEHTINNLDNIV
ncbi:MAG: flagellar hook protein, partial [Butyrivibrio sp.]|nr:flagellar hook protein [Butyrivibrio sp.]